MFTIKNLKMRILVILTACTLALCGGLAFIPPVTAYAEETVIVTVGNTYTFEKDGADCEVTFLEDGNCTIYMDGAYTDGMYVTSKGGKVYLSTVAEFIGTYEVSGNTLVSADVGLTVPDEDTFDNTETSGNGAGNSEISSDIEKPTWLQQVYIHEEDKDHVARITLVDETRVTLEAIYKGNVSGTINGEYKFIKGDVIEIWANGEWFADMQLFSNGTFDYYEEITETPENEENTGGETVEEETLTKEEVTGLIKDAFNKAKDWIKNTYAWIIGIGGGGVLTLLLSIFWKLISSKISRSNNLTEDKVEEICERTTKKVIAGIVGKSLNVDIQSEVSNSVKAELAPMIRNSELAMQSAKNAEVGTAMVLKAVAKSRLISEEETKAMESMADSLLAHAEKYGGLSVPIQIQTELKGEEKAVKETVNLVETPNKPKEKKENESYISF